MLKMTARREQIPDRRAFLTGALSAPGPVRPIGAGPESVFRDLCDGCGACSRACPERVIIRDARGLAVFSPARGACTQCGACISACPTGALSAGNPWLWRAELGPDCLSAAGIACRACEDSCDARAIRFRPAKGGRARPEFEPDTCTGCGGCITACPTGALSLVASDRKEAP